MAPTLDAFVHVCAFCLAVVFRWIFLILPNDLNTVDLASSLIHLLAYCQNSLANCQLQNLLDASCSCISEYRGCSSLKSLTAPSIVSSASLLEYSGDPLLHPRTSSSNTHLSWL